jgi:hypothetical protein
MTEGIRGKWRYDPTVGELVPCGEEVVPYPIHAIHQDTINPTWHPATGQTFDSKSAFRRVTKEKGYVEIDDDRTWASVGRHQNKQLEGLREDIEEVKAWYTAAMRGNKDYINANVPQELRDCEEVNPNDITEGIRR